MNARVTQHAVERYQLRCRPELTFWQARMALKEALSTATPLRERSKDGDELYENEGIMFVIKRDRGVHRPICVTVLTEKPSLEEQMAAELMAKFG